LELPGSIRKGGGLFIHNIGGAFGGNTGIGLSALASNSTGLYNTATGTNSLSWNTTGNYNTATGYTALYSNTIGTNNTAIGTFALEYNTRGTTDTAIGSYALRNNTTGFANTATGYGALNANTTGVHNTATGEQALDSNTTGYYNTAIGSFALFGNTVGSSNTAIGYQAGQSGSSGSSGSNNIAIGYNAGSISGGSSNNIHIGTVGSPNDNGTIRIGGNTALTDPYTQTQFFASGIRGTTTANNDAIPVVIDSAGQLGTISSSRRVKRDIHDMRDTTATILNLHPVEFRYMAHGPDSLLQYGLIAEEVAEIAPDLVARNKDGEIETVYYDKVNAMLLNQVQMLTRKIQQLESRLVDLDAKPK
jgi:hypothetical protein